MKSGDIILVKFPFSNLQSEKKRPCLVISSNKLNDKTGLVSVAMITSRIDGIKLPGDVKILKWEDANLLHPSLIRLAKIATIEDNIIEKNLGRLDPSDLKILKTAFKKHFNYWL